MLRWQPPPTLFFFLNQNDRKGCKRDYLDARGDFILRFSAINDKPLGVVTNPLRKTSVKHYVKILKRFMLYGYF